MCGRFYVDDEMLNEIHKICKKIDENYCYRQGDIRPSEKALIIKAGDNNELYAKSSIWGYELKGSKQLLINARIETIQQKSAYRNDYKYHRCVIPVRGFYEWNQKKEKFRCKPIQNRKILFLAGIYTESAQEDRFTIIITEANEVMKLVHDRMPVIIQEETLPDWLIDKKVVHKDDNSLFIMEHIKKEEEYYQINLFNNFFK